MRFSGRERDIVIALREGPSTGTELAERFGVSRRTILRDIARANAILVRSGAGKIEAEPIYRLAIQSQEKLDGLLSSVYDDATSVCLAILSMPEAAIATVGERTGLSSAAVRQCVKEINRRYGNVLSVELQSSKGIIATFKKSNAADFVATLAARDNAVLAEIRETASPWMSAVGLLSDEIESYQHEMDPWLTLQEARVQIYAAIVTAPFTAGETLSLSTAHNAIRAEIARKRELHSWLLAHRYELIGKASDLLAIHGMKVSRPDLPTILFEHLARSAMFPTLMTDEFRSQIERIQIDHPIEFDYARELCSSLERQRPDIMLEDELCALYIVGTGIYPAEKPVRILLLCGRRSLESVNRAMLENSFENIQVTSVFDMPSAAREYVAGSYEILIRDDSFAGQEPDELPWTLVCRGILSDSDLIRLKRVISDSVYSKTLPQILPDSSFMSLEARGEEYLQVLARGLDSLSRRGALQPEEIPLVMARECQGQCLHFNGIAVPHCITPVPADQPRILALSLDQEVECEGEDIALILIVLVSKRQEDKSSIFSFLYSMLGAGNSVMPGITYSNLIERLGG